MAYQFQNASILVVDDMAPMLALTSSLLKIFGFKDVYQAHDAVEAFDLYCRHNPDIVLTDWHMEPYDGMQFVKKIRTDPASPNKFVPVVMMTGYSHRIRVEEARDSGITEFLVKPFKARDLYARVEQLIEKPRRFVEAERFFGPDRRRKIQDYDGPMRREEEAADKGGNASGAGDASRLLRELKEDIKGAGRTD